MSAITATSLLGAAMQQTGLADFGELEFRDGLERLLASANAEAALSEAGAQRFAASMTGYLVNRLKIIDHAKRHPELTERPIEKPLFVFGLPRTGTTLTINLLVSDPAARRYMRFESLDTVPPVKASGWQDDPRYLKECERLDMSMKYMPHIAAMHWEEADGSSEDQFAMALSFCTQLFDSTFHIPSYHRWFIDEADYEPAFRMQKLQLQVAQAELGGRWTLKNPWHPLYLEALYKVYPDAQMVMTHRDPVQVVGSACSLIAGVRPMFSDNVDQRAIADMLMDTFDAMIARSEAFKAKHGPKAIFDIDYAEQIRDPIGVMGRVYDHFGESLSPEAEAAMRAHLANNPQGKHGKHAYSLEQFGVTADEVRERYSDYRAAYGFA